MFKINICMVIEAVLARIRKVKVVYKAVGQLFPRHAGLGILNMSSKKMEVLVLALVPLGSRVVHQLPKVLHQLEAIVDACTVPWLRRLAHRAALRRR